MSKKLYVGNLSFNSTEDDIRTQFSNFGEVISVNLITDRETGRLRGFGFDRASGAGVGIRHIACGRFFLEGVVMGRRTGREGEDRHQSGGEQGAGQRAGVAGHRMLLEWGNRGHCSGCRRGRPVAA